MKCPRLDDESGKIIKGGKHSADHREKEMGKTFKYVRACMRMLA
jgi:hypothetical protein